MTSAGCRGGRWLVAVSAAGVLASGGIEAQQPVDEDLIEEGRQLFMEETFGGNGRTCATCHPPSNNFTIDPEYVRGLPANDPLFLAGPSMPDLNRLEVRRLLRGHALVLENVDSFKEPGVLRSVPHTLALRTSLEPRSDFPHDHATGWSGDGAPDRGTIRDFAKGAVIQHFPKTLERRECSTAEFDNDPSACDFRLPTDHELDAMEAFQLSLGRQEDIDLSAHVFTDAIVEKGKELFEEAPTRGGGTRSCASCHDNVGANNGDGHNRNFATGTMFLTNAPACLLGYVAPGDGGFGVGEQLEIARAELCGRGPRGGPNATVLFQGDMTINTPPLIEAADTAPFFHNNAAATIEEAVEFYTSDIFHESPAGQAGGGAFDLDQEEIHAIAALLRALNVLENIRSSNAYTEQARWQPWSLSRREEAVDLGIFETTDAIEVLREASVELFANAAVLSRLEEARSMQQQALEQGLPDDLLVRSIELREEARAQMLE